MKIEDIFLRALEPSDIKILMQLENDESYWKYSNTTEPFSKKLLTSFIAEQKRDIFEVKQKRYVISNQNIPTLGFIDLFNFEPLHRRAGVGILIIEKFRGKGLGKKALDLLISHSKKNLNINCLFANIAFENKALASTPHYLDFKLILNQSDAGKKAQKYLKSNKIDYTDFKIEKKGSKIIEGF